VLPVTPAEIEIHRQALTVLRRVLSQPDPCEGCALLLGRRLPAKADRHGPARRLWRLERIWPCLNVWEPAGERTHRFRLDPREQLQAQRWARWRHLEVLGAAHSHPAGAPTPSTTDLALTPGPTLMVILGRAANRCPPESGEAGRGAGNLAEGPLGCWWLSDRLEGCGARAAAASPLLWRMVE
jgi:proteasome lid subunit RPN8/RPN11